MSNVHRIEPRSNENEAEIAMGDLVKCLRRVVELQVGRDASFQEREAAALDLGNESTRRYFEEELQEMANSYGGEILINGVLFRRSHEAKQGIYHSLCGGLDLAGSLNPLPDVEGGKPIR